MLILPEMTACCFSEGPGYRLRNLTSWTDFSEIPDLCNKQYIYLFD